MKRFCTVLLAMIAMWPAAGAGPRGQNEKINGKVFSFDASTGRLVLQSGPKRSEAIVDGQSQIDLRIPVPLERLPTDRPIHFIGDRDADSIRVRSIVAPPARFRSKQEVRDTSIVGFLEREGDEVRVRCKGKKYRVEIGPKVKIQVTERGETGDIEKGAAVQVAGEETKGGFTAARVFVTLEKTPPRFLVGEPKEDGDPPSGFKLK